MKKILVLGNTGLDSSNNSTNNRMKEVFEVMHKKYEFTFDYYKLREAVLEVDYITYINEKANASPMDAFKSIRKQDAKYEIVLAETFNASIVAYMLYVTKKTPFIWRQFGTTFNDELEFKNYFNPKILIKYILHRLISNSLGCKAIVVTEDGCANRTLYLKKLKVNPDKLFMVKNQRTVQSEDANFNKEFHEENMFRLVQIGRITEWKKIHLLLDAIINIKERYPEVAEKIELNIIGKSQDKKYEKILQEKIEANELSKQIFFKKDLEYDEIEEIFKTTDLSISLTAYNPIIESLQNNIPVITYEYGEIGEVFDNCEAVYILAKDIRKSSFLSEKQEQEILSALELKLIELYYNRKELPRLGREGKAYVEKNFPVLNEHVDEIVDIYIKEIDAL